MYRAMQTLHLMFFLGGSAIVIAGSIRFAQTAATLRAHGQTIDGDVLRGPFIGISAGLLAAVLGACAFLLLRRWALGLLDQRRALGCTVVPGGRQR